MHGGRLPRRTMRRTFALAGAPTIVPAATVPNLLLPFGEPYQSLGVSLGVLGLYALVVVLVSSWLRRYISHRLWRGLHYGSFGVFLLVTLHGLLSGSDSGLGWLRSIYFAALASMLFLTVMRLAMPMRGVRAPQ